MSSYNPRFHHRRSIRLKGYDYAKAGLYFITICCKDRLRLFGEIENGIMKLNEMGRIAEKCWLEIPEHFPNVVLHEYVVMPNHVHGIIEFIEAENFSPGTHGGAENCPPGTPEGAKHFSPKTPEGAKHFSPKTPEEGAENIPPIHSHAERIPREAHGGAENIPPIGLQTHGLQPKGFCSPSKTVGSVVRGFKIGVTKWVRQNTDVHEVWQRNYYEHIIRNEQANHRIAEYILNNPLKWQADKFNMK